MASGAPSAQLELPVFKGRAGWEFTDLSDLDLEAYTPAPVARAGGVGELWSLDEQSRSDTYPTIRIGEDDVDVGHEATVSKVGEEQLFYLMAHGIPEDEASKLIVNGFIEPIVKELPMEYAVEMNRLIELQMEGSIG